MEKDSIELKLQEITASDYFGGQWDEFVKKYKKFKKDEAIYVQFTNNISRDALNKGSHPNPDHSDPMGVYGYPLEYVLNYPGDIWYGASMNHIRVLSEKYPEKTLILQNIGYSVSVENLVKKLYSDGTGLYHASGRAESNILKTFASEKNKEAFKETLPARKFFFMIQHDMEKTEPSGGDTVRYFIYDSKTQTERLRKLGYYAIKDMAKKDTKAIINDREPQQIIFLYPSAFDVLDVYKLEPKYKGEKGLHTTSSADFTVKIRKLAAQIALQLGEKLVPQQTGEVVYSPSYSDTPRTIARNTYFTDKGTKIYVSEEDASIKYRMDNTKWGQKVHRAYKVNPHYYRVALSGVKGDFSTVVGYEDPVEEDVKYLVDSYNALTKNNPPRSHAGEVAAYKTAEDKATQDRIDAQYKKDLAEYPSFLKALKNIWVNLKLPKVTLPKTNKDKMILFQAIEYSLRRLAYGVYTQGHWVSLEDDKVTKAKLLNTMEAAIAEPADDGSVEICTVFLRGLLAYILEKGKLNAFNYFSNIYSLNRTLEELNKGQDTTY